MQSLALVVHVALAIGVIVLVLIQHGKGADAGAAFGSGASATVFGARGSASFLTRLTTLLASLFFMTSLFLFYLAAHRDRGLSSVTDSPSGVVEEAPAATDLPDNVGASESDAPASDDAPATDDTPAGTGAPASAGAPAADTDTVPAASDSDVPK